MESNSLRYMCRDFLQSVRSLCNQEDFKSATEILKDLYSRVLPIYFIQDTPNYHPDIIKILIKSLIPLSEFKKDLSFNEYVDSFIKHILTLGISFCPKYMLQSIPSIIHQNNQPIFYQYLTSYFSILVSGYLPYDKQALCVDDLYSMISSTPASYLANIPEPILFLFLNHKSEEEISNLLVLFMNSNNIRSLQILISKNVDTLLPKVLLSAPPKTISKILSSVSGEHLTKLDIVPILARFSDLLAEEMPVKVNYVLSSLKKIVPYVIEKNRECFKPIFKIILDKLKNVPDFNIKHRYLGVLVESEKYNLIKLEEFEQYLEKSNPLCLKEILQLYNNIINRNDSSVDQVNDKYFEILKKITSNRNKRSLSLLVKLFATDSENIKTRIGEDNYKFIYNRIFCPISFDEKVQSLIIDLLIKNNDYTKFNEVVYDLIEYQTVEHSKSYINKLKSAIDNHFHILIYPSKLDWFGQFSYQYFTFIDKNVTAGFYEEFLRGKFFEPKDTDYLIRSLSKNCSSASPNSFKQACSVLRSALQIMGYKNKWEFTRRCVDINSIQDPDPDENHWWFSTKDLEILFNELGEKSISESKFGIIVSNIVNLIISLKKNYKELDGSIIIYLTLCARFLKPCLPKLACRLLTSVYNDTRNADKIKNFDKDRKASYEKEYRLFFTVKDSTQKQQPQQQQQNDNDKSESSEKSDKSDVFGSFESSDVSEKSKAFNVLLNDIFSGYQIHFNASPDFVKMYVRIYGKEKLFSDDKISPFVRDAISKDAEIASMFQSYFNQPLPLMPTFNSFTDEKHQKWAEECKAKIPEYDWILPPKPLKKTSSKFELPPEKSNYEFIKPEIEAGPQMHKLEPSTKFGLISFLFHCDRRYVYPFVTQEKLDEIEKYVYENTNPNDDKNDPRLLLGYICFVMSHGINIDVIKWLKKAEIKDNKDKLTLYAAALLLEAVRIKTNLVKLPEVTQFYERILDKIGIYDHSPQSIVRVFEGNMNTIDDYHYRKSNGDHLSSFEWLFIRSVIGLDIFKYEKLSPFRITGEFSDISNGNKVIQYGLQILEKDQSFTNLANFVSGLTYLFIGNTRNRHFRIGKCRYYYLLPSNMLYHSVFVMLDENKITEPQKQVDYGKGMSEQILKSFKKFNFSKTKTIPLSVELFLVNMLCTEKEYIEIIQLIRQKVGHNPDLYMHNTYNVDDITSNDTFAVEALNFRPPSEVRKFYRCLLRHLVEKKSRSIKLSMDKLIATKLDHYNIPPPVNIRNLNINDRNCDSSFIVFPLFCYTGALYFGMTPWNLHDYDINLTSSNHGTFLLLKKFDLETLMGCRIEMMEPNEESANMFKTIALLTNDDLRKSKAWPNATAAVVDFATVLLTTAVSERCSVYMADFIFRIITKTLKLEVIADILYNQDFLVKGKFANTLLLFRRLEKFLIASKLNDIVDKKCKKFHDKNSKMFKDNQKKNDAFIDPNSQESIFASLHADQGDSSADYSLKQTTTAQPQKQEAEQKPKEEEKTVQIEQAHEEEQQTQLEEQKTNQEEQPAKTEEETHQEEQQPQTEQSNKEEEQPVKPEEQVQQEEPAQQEEQQPQTEQTNKEEPVKPEEQIQPEEPAQPEEQVQQEEQTQPEEPVQTEEQPAQTEELPAQTEEQPAQTEELPAQTEEQPAQTEELPPQPEEVNKEEEPVQTEEQTQQQEEPHKEDE